MMKKSEMKYGSAIPVHPTKKKLKRNYEAWLDEYNKYFREYKAQLNEYNGYFRVCEAWLDILVHEVEPNWFNTDGSSEMVSPNCKPVP